MLCLTAEKAVLVLSKVGIPQRYAMCLCRLHISIMLYLNFIDK